LLSKGFPRADLDIAAIRISRSRIIYLRNDLKAVMDQLHALMPTLFVAPSSPVPSKREEMDVVPAEAPEEVLQPFARVNGVAPDSPAHQAVRFSACPSA
jgi:26S proteasome non-ATPase regulatory subunit 9